MQASRQRPTCERMRTELMRSARIYDLFDWLGGLLSRRIGP
jgi:hypothetical protein